MYRITEPYLPALQTPNPNIYSIRQLSPFQGLIQVIRSDIARAISIDGRQWQIQVICEAHQQEWGIGTEDNIQRRYVLYGTWSKASGLYSMPLEPMLDVPSDEDIQQQLIKRLESHYDKIPFPQLDCYELWVLDSENLLPIALLASSIDRENINNIHVTRWRAYTAGDKTFKPKRAQCNTNPALLLEQLISNHTQSPVLCQWFHRNDDGSAQAINVPDSKPELDGRKLSANDFPELLIKAHWPDLNIEILVEEYHEWLAPKLLCLQNIQDSTREMLEHAASHQALLSSQLLPLFPKTINQKIINKIMVETTIRKSTSSSR